MPNRQQIFAASGQVALAPQRLQIAEVGALRQLLRVSQIKPVTGFNVTYPPLPVSLPAHFWLKLSLQVAAELVRGAANQLSDG